MQMMAATAALLFAVGFAGGYLLRAALSWFRRNRMRKLRADRETEALMKQTAVTAPGLAQADAGPAVPNARAMAGSANA